MKGLLPYLQIYGRAFVLPANFIGGPLSFLQSDKRASFSSLNGGLLSSLQILLETFKFVLPANLMLFVVPANLMLGSLSYLQIWHEGLFPTCKLDGRAFVLPANLMAFALPSTCKSDGRALSYSNFDRRAELLSYQQFWRKSFSPTCKFCFCPTCKFKGFSPTCKFDGFHPICTFDRKAFTPPENLIRRFWSNLYILMGELLSYLQFWWESLCPYSRLHLGP